MIVDDDPARIDMMAIGLMEMGYEIYRLGKRG